MDRTGGTVGCGHLWCRVERLVRTRDGQTCRVHRSGPAEVVAGDDRVRVGLVTDLEPEASVYVELEIESLDPDGTRRSATAWLDPAEVDRLRALLLMSTDAARTGRHRPDRLTRPWSMRATPRRSVTR